MYHGWIVGRRGRWWYRRYVGWTWWCLRCCCIRPQKLATYSNILLPDTRHCLHSAHQPQADSGMFSISGHTKRFSIDPLMVCDQLWKKIMCKKSHLYQTGPSTRLAVDMKFPIHIHIHRRLSCVHVALKFSQTTAVQEHSHLYPSKKHDADISFKNCFKNK